MSKLTVLDVLRRSTAWLAERGIEQPRLDAELLIAHALDIDRLDLYVRFDRPMTESELEQARGLIRARAQRKPVAYLLGRREFYSLSFDVDERVLVPRPETEHLVDVALEFLRPIEQPRFADVGTGSGCITVAVLSNLPGAEAEALDLSPQAREVAEANARKHEVDDRVRFHTGDLLAPLKGTEVFGRLDAVLSNPPYVRVDDPDVEEGVREHEPRTALFVSGDDPLEYVRRLAEESLEALRPGGLLACEVGYGSGAAAEVLLAERGYGLRRLVKDFAGTERIVVGHKPG